MNAFDRVKGMDRIFCGLYLLLGYGFIWMFTNSTSAWCLPVYTVFYAAVVLLYARTLGICPVKESWFWFVILLILGISQEIDNGMMVGRFLALLLVAAYWTFAVSGDCCIRDEHPAGSYSMDGMHWEWYHLPIWMP